MFAKAALPMVIPSSVTTSPAKELYRKTSELGLGAVLAVKVSALASYTDIVLDSHVADVVVHLVARGQSRRGHCRVGRSGSGG